MEVTDPVHSGKRLYVPFIKAVIAGMSAVGLPIILWIQLYPYSDWAALALLPLVLMTFYGSYQITLNKKRGNLLAVIKSGSPISKILKGRISSFFVASIITAIATPMIAYKALAASGEEALIFIALGMAAIILFQMLQVILGRHVNEQFLPSVSTRFSYVIAGFIFLPVYTYFTWAVVEIPGYFRGATFPDAMLGVFQDS